MKRSTQIGLGAAGVILVASAWSMLGGEEEQLVFETVAECRQEGTFTAEQCEQRFAEARDAHAREARRFPSTASCEAEYGPGRCEARRVNGTDVIVPAFVGIMVARALAGGGGQGPAPLMPPTRQTCPPGSQLEECQPSSRSGGGGSSGGGGGGGSSRRRAYSTTTGDPVVSRGGSARVAVSSRGGFGSTGRSVGSSHS